MRRVLIGLAAAALALCLAAPASAATTWTRQLVPLPGAATSGELLGVSCTSLTQCVAVGGVSPGRTTYTEIARWDGTAWSSREVPVPGTKSRRLAAVSCASADCIAVGSDTSRSSGRQPLALRRHGGRWSQQSLPLPSGTDASLTAVSCASATSCTAVGSISPGSNSLVPLAEHWDGSSWTVQPTPSPAGATSARFTGVSCVSDTSCTAVGSIFTSPPANFEPLAEHWDGSAWSITSIANPPGVNNTLNGVSCSSALSCTAVGSTHETSSGLEQPLAEHWDGSAWSIQPTPATSTNSELNAVSCPSATACTAAGDYPPTARPLAEFWNGSTWKRQPTAQPVLPGPLEGISCTYAHHCVAVGFGQAPTGFTPLLALREQ